MRRNPARPLHLALLPWLACAALLSGCALHAPAPASPITVSVTNQNWNRATVYLHAVDGGGIARRLGDVEFNETRRWRIAARVAGSGGVIIRARLLADGRIVETHPILVNPGDLVEWTLDQLVSTSRLLIRHPGPDRINMHGGPR